jgi:2-polyprenyl-6-methoxyphenol hydroxylase-like FAD-dependent oxidoreductase
VRAQIAARAGDGAGDVNAARTALIVGAGIAGTTAAGALQRKGIQVRLIEREPEPTFRGIGIVLLPPAVRSMHMLGLVDACLQRGFPQDVSRTHSADGTVLARRPLVGLAGPEDPPAIGLPRPAFGEILCDWAVEAGVDLRYGLTVTAIDDCEDGVEVELSDGTSGHYDVVVGADGLRSAVRAMVFPEQPAPTYIGQGIWRVLVGVRPPQVDGQLLFLGKTTRAGFNPILSDDMYMYFLHQTDEGRPHLTRDQSHELLIGLLAEYGGLVAEVRDLLTPDNASHYGLLYTIFVAGDWHRGRVILIGDAAHATPPHLASGAGIAIEDGIVLARCLSECDTVGSGFELFMRRRYERCRMVIENSRTLSRWDLDPNAPGGQAATLTTDTWAALSAPI